ncbi:(deoxy)nucleoside triphosphate pyrophosphohydrolase [Nocardioides solisilvae]|uniref:(deoxy)nucleoside triphosphate pyrophosphohydrolase n=1 Tax=Nocardioides solisilvae TaxID=1542435 RepID=UPI000D74A04E|nr:(deoxy)nucleoside triphosphate pyrophosphohydrolase [Nocardioides solisilvae]
MAKQINVVGAVITSGGRILCVQRGPGGALAGMWEFPGGKVEPGEEPIDALIREIREELSCDIAARAKVTTTVYPYEFATISLTTFHCDLLSGTPTLSEHTAMKWLPTGELAQLDWAPADIPAVDLLASHQA